MSYPQVDNAKLGFSYKEPKLLFYNNGDGSFHETSAVSDPLRTPQVSRGLAVGDLFNTGHLDIVIENLTGAPMILQTNPDPTEHWVSFQLEGGTSNRLALNARVIVRTGSVQQMSEVLSGGSYLSQNDLRLHFGLGASTMLDSVLVHWPDGTEQTFEHLPVDRFYHLKEGSKPSPQLIR